MLGLRIVREMEAVAWHSLEGQAIELGWIRENVFELERRRLSQHGPEEDLLARDHPSHPRWRTDRQPRQPSTSNRSSASAFFSARPFRSRTISSISRPTPLREGTQR